MAKAAYGVMTGREFEARVAEFCAPTLEKMEAEDRKLWNRINVDFKDGLFTVRLWGHKVGMLAHRLRAAGFRFNGPRKVWETQEPKVVARIPELLRKSEGAARDALKRELRLAASEATFARAAERMLEPGDLERIRAMLTPPMAAALRQGIALLDAADDDRASERNGVGFSKAHTELGHSLHVVGITKVRHAALARKVLWPYRNQLPAEIVSAAFPVAGTDVVAVEEVSPATPPDALTLVQAEELVAGPVESIVKEVRDSTVAIKDAQPEPDTRRLPPFLQETRLPLARIEGGATLVLVSRAKKPVRLELRMAA